MQVNEIIIKSLWKKNTFNEKITKISTLFI